MSCKVIKQEDGEGKLITVGESVYKGETLTHDKNFKIGPVLENLESFTPLDTDVWLISYPRSGTHWLHEILGILLSGELHPHSSYVYQSLIEAHQNVTDISHVNNTRTYDTHLRLHHIPQHILHTSKLIYIIRNPKSVAVSYYHLLSNLKSLDYEGSFSGFLPVFMRGFYTLRGSWFQHVKEYYAYGKDRGNVLFVFYEELRRDTSAVVKGISDFLGLGRSQEFCDKVVEITSFQNMSAGIDKPQETVDTTSTLFKRPGPNIFRKGCIDEWKSVFTVAQNEEFDVTYNELLQHYPELVNRIQFS